ncbi:MULTISPECIES: HlyD family secretion protein [unclassified Treponema]|uniref:HlyD family secretion protein n=1 Tax=unclassified Treponema TaxID=2638727 RepID=UPI0020A3E2BC|nr:MULTISPECIES: HlyD family efflux transporter periplasmic adaptor subunit [unclassified Treponema]UTC66126.1 HlyD family efflux transporter periplasmic adaptor subunit [Treponema sp. OMZ 789]UTC68855.1 HlyD family efflux transporter periplasmic adaptor subunit [Treponema sp. OMZ 790]UTC71583.1 HlyD family efflux transporter periplasmic adaptor subunit [Treponema sp. OMZ 791]
MKSILYVEDLTYTGEVLHEQKTGIFSSVVFIICLLAVFSIGWIVLGEKEEVVRASGMVRPIDNISFVKTFTAGKIKNIYFTSGQYVEKGDLLLSIDDSLAEKERENIENLIFKLEKKIEDAGLCIESAEKDVMLVPPEREIAYKHMENYFSVKTNLEKTLELNTGLLEEEKSLPDFSLASKKLEILNLNVEKSKSDLEQYKNSFFHSLLREKEALEAQNENLKNSLFRVQEDLKLFSLHAPISGEIQELSSLNCGDNVFSGQEILKIVPSTSENIRAVLRLPSSKAGLIKENMKVRLKFPAFPHHEFGSLDGLVETILPDVSSGAKNAEYFVFVKLDGNTLPDKKGMAHFLKVGLDTEASIVTQTGSILSFILKRLEVK